MTSQDIATQSLWNSQFLEKLVKMYDFPARVNIPTSLCLSSLIELNLSTIMFVFDTFDDTRNLIMYSLLSHSKN